MKELNIWFICIGEPIPQNNNFENLHRCGSLAYNFSKKGHNVKWITSNFNHFTKSSVDIDNSYKVSNKFEIILLKTMPYKKNISLERFISHYFISKEFVKEIGNFKNIPDIIYVSFPTIELSYRAVKFANKNNIPVIVDIRDLWPDIFLSAIPSLLHPIAKTFLYPWYYQKKYTFKNANSIIAISNYFLSFGTKYLSSNNNLNKVFLKSFKKNTIYKKAKINSKIKVIYLGAISKNKLNFDVVINAFNKIGNNFELIVCGDGDDLNFYKSKSSNNIIYKGFVNKEEFGNYIAEADIGIVPLNNRFDFTTQLVNKSIEYLSYGIPILNSLEGELKEFVLQNKIGFNYGSSKELINCLNHIYNDNELLDTFSENAKRVFNEKFDFDSNFERFENHFFDVLNDN
jgi:glycosyltransferase involved in cell wall biosynthesis